MDGSIHETTCRVIGLKCDLRVLLREEPGLGHQCRARPQRVNHAHVHSGAQRAKWLSWASLAYMAVEGAVAIVAGIVAGSIALIGFGIDSAIEGFASVVIVWRFTGSRILSGDAERRAQKLVAIQFFILAPYVGIEAVRSLIDGDPSR
jgi:divalent metal cation (Fe/Co/Zn/Cd) transporter